MTILTFSAVLLVASFFAGLIGALTGLGGGVIVVPVLVLLFGVDIHHAAGAALISVISTSSGAAIPYIRSRLCNIRIGMFLEMATTVGAVVGAYLAARMSASIIAVIFGAILLHAAYSSVKRQDDGKPGKPDGLAKFLNLGGRYPGKNGDV
ncbi:MAG: permease, partial [Candidatus Melainabacteria bacterium]